jgi:sugar phosphate isomerase/epimerase
MSARPIGLQLYGVRSELACDFRDTLRQVAEAGYEEVEFAGYGGLSAPQMAALLREFKLRAVGSHVGLRLLDQDLEGEIDYCLAIDCPSIAIPTLTPQWRSTTAEGYRALAAYLSRIGRRCRQRGITLVYHNHDFDFVQDEGRYLLDILLAESDPDDLQLELDCGWTAYCAVDPVAYLHAYAGRVPLVHLKDLAADRSFIDLGAGTLDIAAHYHAALACGAQRILIDNDTPQPPVLDSVRRSLAHLRRILLDPVAE